jgi:hypothetical protein
MRFKVFVSLLVITLVLDIALLSFSMLRPEARVFELPVALAAEPPDTSAPQPTATAIPATPTAISAPPIPPPTATHTPAPTASPAATAEATATAVATIAPPARLLAAKSVAFTPADKAVRANIRLALDHYYGALTHVVLPPGGVFSFNSTLGVRPQRLPWKNVKLKPTAAPPAPPAPDGTSLPTPAPVVVQSIQGGGLCDLASRFVMAARPLLPGSAFRFVNHVKSNGVHLSGVPTRDTVSIWAVGGGQGEHDLLISNPTNGWLEFTVDRDGEKISVTARLWDSSPPGW